MDGRKKPMAPQKHERLTMFLKKIKVAVRRVAEPHYFCKLDSDPDPIRVKKLDPDPDTH